MSNKFNLDISQDKYFPQTVPVTALEHTDASDNIEDAIENCVDLSNDHRGFTLVMWYSRYEINDNSLIGMATKRDEGQVDAVRINYHTIKILPTNSNILKRDNQLNTEWNELKFKVGDHL